MNFKMISQHPLHNQAGYSFFLIVRPSTLIFVCGSNNFPLFYYKQKWKLSAPILVVLVPRLANQGKIAQGWVGNHEFQVISCTKIKKKKMCAINKRARKETEKRLQETLIRYLTYLSLNLMWYLRVGKFQFKVIVNKPSS